MAQSPRRETRGAVEKIADVVAPAKVRAPRVRGLGRTRVYAELANLWERRFALVIAPAGFGKTTALAHFAAGADVPVAWYRAEGADASEESFLAHLERACAGAVERLRVGWESIEDAAAALDELERPADAKARLLVVIDDLHTLHDTPAEAALDRLLACLPAGCPILAGSRRPPSFPLSRLRVQGDLLELGPDHLRFRAWEVEQLFTDVYEDRLAPGELSTLTQRTEGWAAGLQLFHLASRGKAPTERLRLVNALGSRSKLVREYLADNVLGELPSELRDFLVRTCVLTVLTGALCDELLDRDGSAEVLADLEARQLFCVAVDEDGTYRYHEVLRSHLEGELAASGVSARDQYRRAAQLYEKADWPVEAIRAYARAEDWDDVNRLMEEGGAGLLGQPGAWVDSLPPAVVADDPWLMLASARRALAHGHLQAAANAYARAEEGFASGAGSEVSRSERMALRPWLTERPDRVDGLSGLLRAATMHEPATVAREASAIEGPSGRLVEGLALVLAGRAGDGQRILLNAADHPDATPLLRVACRAAAVLAPLWGDAEDIDANSVAEEADTLGVPWATRLGAATVALRSGGALPAGLRQSFDVEFDQWGAAMFALHLGLAQVGRGEPAVVVLDEAVARLGFLGADVVEAWAKAALAHALAAAGRPEAVDTARAVAEDARRLALPGVAGLAMLAAARAEGSGSPWRQRADAVLDRAGLPRLAAWAYATVGDQVPSAGTVGAGLPGRLRTEPPPVLLRCLGAFRLELAGATVDLTSVKPRARSLLRLLSLHAPRPVHREVLAEALWPEADSDAATRNLQVAISSLRQVLEPGVARGSHTLLVRDGDAYRLALPEGSDSDLAAFSEAIAESRAASARRSADEAREALHRALALYVGDVLPEEGPADWAVAVRDQVRSDAVEAATRLAELCLAAGEPVAAVEACEQGLRTDRYRDALWRLLGDAHRAAGDHAAAARAERDYAQVLSELGVE